MTVVNSFKYICKVILFSLPSPSRCSWQPSSTDGHPEAESDAHSKVYLSVIIAVVFLFVTIIVNDLPTIVINIIIIFTILFSRNVFIANLAVSDLGLCLVTMPLTLYEVNCRSSLSLSMRSAVGHHSHSL